MGHNSVVSGYPKSIGIPWVDRLSTGPSGFGASQGGLLGGLLGGLVGKLVVGLLDRLLGWPTRGLWASLRGGF